MQTNVGGGRIQRAFVVLAATAAAAVFIWALCAGSAPPGTWAAFAH